MTYRFKPGNPVFVAVKFMIVLLCAAAAMVVMGFALAFFDKLISDAYAGGQGLRVMKREGGPPEQVASYTEMYELRWTAASNKWVATLEPGRIFRDGFESGDKKEWR